jgi:hypothetical protein
MAQLHHALTVVLVALAAVSVAARDYPISNGVPHCEDPSVQNKTLFYDLLIDSRQMPAQEVQLRVGVPFSTLVAFFDQPQYWTVWNHLFATNFVTDYSLCAPFDNVTYTNPPPVNPPFPATMTAPHYIDQHGYDFLGTTFAFGWIFQLVNQGEMLVFGRHTFTLRSNDAGLSSIAQSWEKAAGPQLQQPGNGLAWTIALQESLLDAVNGFVCLERVYTRTSGLALADVVATCKVFKA